MRRKTQIDRSRVYFLSGYQIMWVMVMFDLPTETKLQRKQYAKFRQALLENGFHAEQYSVYARPCSSDERAEMFIERVKEKLPPHGSIKIIKFTDKQFGRMQVFIGKLPTKATQPPEQLSFF